MASPSLLGLGASFEELDWGRFRLDNRNRRGNQSTHLTNLLLVDPHSLLLSLSLVGLARLGVPSLLVGPAFLSSLVAQIHA